MLKMLGGYQKITSLEKLLMLTFKRRKDKQNLKKRKEKEKSLKRKRKRPNKRLREQNLRKKS